MKFDFKGNTSQDGEPTPENPQQIHVVTGDNDVIISNKNLFDKNKINIAQAYISSANLYRTSTGNVRTIIFPTLPNKTYTVSKTSGDVFRLAYTNSLPSNNDTVLGMVDIGTGNYGTITVGNEAQYLLCYVYGSTDTITIEEMINSIQIEGGTEATQYQPHQEQTYRVDFGGKNLCSSDFEQGTMSTTTGENQSGSTRIRTVGHIKVNGSTTYTLSATASSQIDAIIYEYDANKVYKQTISSSFGTMPYTFTTSENIEYIRIVIRYHNNNAISVSEITNIQVEKSSTATRYSRYVENPIEMCKTGDYQDYLYKENGKWYKYNAVGKKVYTSIASAGANTNPGELSYIGGFGSLDDMLSGNWLFGYGNLFKSTTDKQHEGFRLGANNKNVYIYTDNLNFSNKNNADNFLTNNPFVLYYPLETPTTTQITDTTLIEQLDEIYYNAVSYEDQTNISQTNADLPFVIGASAIKKYSE